MYPRDTENSILAVLKYDTCWYLIKTLELPTRTNDAHVPDTGHLRQAFPSSFPAFFPRAPVVVVFSICNLNYQQGKSIVNRVCNKSRISV